MKYKNKATYKKNENKYIIRIFYEKLKLADYSIKINKTL